MPPINPEKLTISQLQRELKKHKVSFPMKAKKDDYIKLYRRHILKGKLGFSSDEEEPSPRSFSSYSSTKLARSQIYQTSNRTPPRKGAYKIIFQDKLSDVEDMTDRKLRTELQRRNVEVGPIVGTTRQVYERKLAELMSAEVEHGPTRTRSTMVSFHDDESDEDEDVDGEEEEEEEDAAESDEEVEEVQEEVEEEEEHFSDSDLEEQEEEPVSGRGDTRLRRSTRLQALSSNRSSLSSRPVPSRLSTSTTHRTYRMKKPSKRYWWGLPLWFWWLLVLVCVGLFIYSIWLNMEDSKPEIGDK